MKFQIEVTKILEILSTKIYDSPLAMLRENVQNAYDAILLRNYYFPHSFNPQIDVKITENLVEISDNGIGMTLDDLRNHFWRAGASGKNTTEAKAAGVVGTFGIGGLANFGICQKLTVISESIINAKRTKCEANRDTLSLDEDCIIVEDLESLHQPGTTIIAELPSDRHIQIKEAVEYLSLFVKHIQVPIFVNGVLVSHQPLELSCPPDSNSELNVFQSKTDDCECQLTFQISETGIVWVKLENIVFKGNKLEGQMLLKQGMAQIMAFRSGFGLAITGVSSYYSFGGVANLTILQPTAGRDALTSTSVQMIQDLVSSVERTIATLIAGSPLADMNTSFMNWVIRNSQYELLGNLKVTLYPTEKKVTLNDVKNIIKEINYYKGTDESIATKFATEEKPLIRISRSNPRGKCEEEYLTRFCKAVLISGDPQILEVIPSTSWTRGEAALAFRMERVIESDYFVEVKVTYGHITHNLPLFINTNVRPLTLILDNEHSSIQTLVRSYESAFEVYDKFVKDFARVMVFPRISNFVPSSTREGAEAFLKILRRQKDVFEYDINDLKQLDDVIVNFTKGNTSFKEVANIAINIAHKQQQVVSVQDVQTVANVMPDIVTSHNFITTSKQENEEIRTTVFDAKPAIFRSDVETDAKILVLADSEVMYDYQGLLRLSDKAYSDRSDFFFQPHYTEVIWGGQRIIFIFRHHSGTFGFYYDIQLNEALSIPSGGHSFETMTVLLRNSVFLPIPSNLFKYFIPSEDQKKRFDVRYDILYTESASKNN